MLIFRGLVAPFGLHFSCLATKMPISILKFPQIFFGLPLVQRLSSDPFLLELYHPTGS
jgi:hypothetical protein